MTAEIAVLNKRAVALATDSAVTFAHPRGEKIYFSANKLFMLSKHQPVGIMFYGAAQFMGIPWETIVKVYRDRLGKRKFDTLEQYAQDFLAFLEAKDNGLYSEEQQGDHFELIIAWIAYTVEEKLNDPSLLPSDLENAKDIVDSIIVKLYDEWVEAEDLPSFPDDHGQKVLERYGQFIEGLIEKRFTGIPVSEKSHNLLLEICAFLPVKDIFPDTYAGVVISGFGDKDIYPSLISYDLEAVILNHLKYRRDREFRIQSDMPAAIVPFAQSEMVFTFMEGIDPDYEQLLERYTK